MTAEQRLPEETADESAFRAEARKWLENAGLWEVLSGPFRHEGFRSFINFTCFWHFATMVGAPFISLFLLSAVVLKTILGGTQVDLAILAAVAERRGEPRGAIRRDRMRIALHGAQQRHAEESERDECARWISGQSEHSRRADAAAHERLAGFDFHFPKIELGARGFERGADQIVLAHARARCRHQRMRAQATLQMLTQIVLFIPGDAQQQRFSPHRPHRSGKRIRVRVHDAMAGLHEVKMIDIDQLIAEVDRLRAELMVKNGENYTLRRKVDTHECVPTQWAYDQACKALEKHRVRADAAEAKIAAARALADREEQGAQRYQDPMPIPEWVEHLRNALDHAA